MNDKITGAFWGTVVVWAILIVVLGGFYGLPRYNVWQQEMSGKAEFAKAEQNRRIKIEEAKANLEAEKLNAQAEVERAKGAAEENRKWKYYASVHSIFVGSSAE